MSVNSKRHIVSRLALQILNSAVRYVYVLEVYLQCLSPHFLFSFDKIALILYFNQSRLCLGGESSHWEVTAPTVLGLYFLHNHLRRDKKKYTTEYLKSTASCKKYWTSKTYSLSPFCNPACLGLGLLVFSLLRNPSQQSASKKKEKNTEGCGQSSR